MFVCHTHVIAVGNVDMRCKRVFGVHIVKFVDMFYHCLLYLAQKNKWA